MPNVPRVPGVPPLTSYLISSTALLLRDVLRQFGLLAPQWGVYLDGEAVLTPDSYVSFEFKQDFPISDYPVEEGRFQTYNKVQLPSDIRLKISAGGSDANRQALLEQIDEVMTTTDLYDVVTPEKVYLGYNFTHRDFRRTSNHGLGLLVVDLWMTEVRTSASSTFSNTQVPGIAGSHGVGNVQPQDVPDDIDRKFRDGSFTVH